MKIKIGVSNRHVHLTKEDVSILFGENYKLTKMKDLSQKGQYACNETLTIKTDKNEFKNVRIVGPEREKMQVEISKTDAYFLGINPPVRNSGFLDDASLITIIGPRGEISKDACIIATRHIHITKEDAIRYNLNKSKVSVVLNGEKSGILNDVNIRISSNATFEMHLDTDDANAFLVSNNDEATIIEE